MKDIREEVEKLVLAVVNTSVTAAEEVELVVNKIHGLFCDIWNEQQTRLEHFAHRYAYAKEYRDHHQHKSGDENAEVWFWQNDGVDHPESLASDISVIIRAEWLRDLMRTNVDTRMRVKMDGSHGHEIEGHWFYLHPVDEHAKVALTVKTETSPPLPTDYERLIKMIAAANIALKSDLIEIATSAWNDLPDHLKFAIEAQEEMIDTELEEKFGQGDE